MRYSVADIAAAVGAVAVGETDLVVTSLAEPADADAAALALASTPKYAEALASGAAQAALLWPDADWQALGLKAAILPNRPRYAMSGMTRMFDPGQGFPTGIHPTALVDPSATLGANVSIGAYSIIGARAQIGADTVIGPQCYVGVDVQIGERGFLREQVSIGARVQIGTAFFAHPGARIGSDGFSFVTEEKSGTEAVRETLGDQGDTKPQSWHRIHSLGSVIIGDEVEIGANTTVDNGTITPTFIGDRTKIDNLAQVSHNVRIGRDCLLCGHSGVAGSSVLGNNVVLGGQSGVADHVQVGDRVVLGGAAAAMSNVPAGSVMMGNPATKMQQHIDIYKAMRRLPRAMADLASLKKAVFKSPDSD